MKRTNTKMYVNLGPPVPLVPGNHFDKIPKEVIELAWQLVGPSVQRNLSDVRSSSLWEIFAACYAEGVNHGMSAMKEKRET